MPERPGSTPADAAPNALFTYEDLVRLGDDDLRHEIIGGEHFVTPSPRTRHQRTLGNLHVALRAAFHREGVGEVFLSPYDIVFTPIDVVVPDLIVVLDPRAHLVSEKHLTGAADLVVEILSPGTRSRDLGIKKRLYEREGVTEYWVVSGDDDELLRFVLGAPDSDGARSYGEPERCRESVRFGPTGGAVIDLREVW